MNQLPEVRQLLAVLNKKKHLMNTSELSLLWDLYHYLAKDKSLGATEELELKKLELCITVWDEVIAREESGEEPLSEVADLKYRVLKLEENLDKLFELINKLGSK